MMTDQLASVGLVLHWPTADAVESRTILCLWTEHWLSVIQASRDDFLYLRYSSVEK